MHIHEAINATTPHEPFITRAIWARVTSKPCGAAVKVQPTNSPDCCIIESIINKAPCRGWQPTAEDLTADDWAITG